MLASFNNNQKIKPLSSIKNTPFIYLYNLVLKGYLLASTDVDVIIIEPIDIPIHRNIKNPNILKKDPIFLLK